PTGRSSARRDTRSIFFMSRACSRWSWEAQALFRSTDCSHKERESRRPHHHEPPSSAANQCSSLGRNRSPAGTRAQVLFGGEWAKWDLCRKHLSRHDLRQKRPTGLAVKGGFVTRMGKVDRVAWPAGATPCADAACARGPLCPSGPGGRVHGQSGAKVP